MILTKDQILAARPRIVTLNVPEWDGDVMIRPLTLAGASQVFADKDNPDGTKLMMLILVASICDESGKLLFDESDIPALSGSLSLDSVKLISERATTLNGMAPGADEEAAKNYGPSLSS